MRSIRSRRLLTRERSRSRSNVAVPASAYSSSNPISPVSSDWLVPNEDSSSSLYWASRSFRSARSCAFSSWISFLDRGVLVAMVEVWRTVASRAARRQPGYGIPTDRIRPVPDIFARLPPKPDHPAIELDILERWERGSTFERLRALNRGGPMWSFIDGPMTANKVLPVHTAWGRTLKDV